MTGPDRFDHWPRPLVDAPDGPRLERRWGTLFMDLAYNDAEAAHRTLNRSMGRLCGVSRAALVANE